MRKMKNNSAAIKTVFLSVKTRSILYFHSDYMAKFV